MNSALIDARRLWVEAGLPEDYLKNLRLHEKPDPIIDTSFKLGSVAQVHHTQSRILKYYCSLGHVNRLL